MGRIFVAILFQRGGIAVAIERLVNFSDEVTEKRSSSSIRCKRNRLNEVVGL